MVERDGERKQDSDSGWNIVTESLMALIPTTSPSIKVKTSLKKKMSGRLIATVSHCGDQHKWGIESGRAFHLSVTVSHREYSLPRLSSVNLSS